MPVEMQYPDMHTTAIRVMLLGSMTSAYYESTDDERRERILPRFKQIAEEWRGIGARMVGTLDDDLFMVGEPLSTNFTFYLLFEVDEPAIASKMIQPIRETVNGVRMDQYVRFEARIGRPFFLLEES